MSVRIVLIVFLDIRRAILIVGRLISWAWGARVPKMKKTS